MSPAELARRLTRLARRRPVAELAGETLSEIAGGRLARLPVPVRFWDGSVLPAGDPAAGPDAPVVVITRPRAIAHLLHEPGELGFSRAWVDGSLALEGDLERILALRGTMQAVTLAPGDRSRLLLAALRAAGPSILRRPPIPAIEARPGGGAHSIESDRAAVRHHYDVSNDFYRLVLGETMVYSCAYFEDAGDALADAQERKLDLICRKLDLHAGERLLDVGCGWGSLIIHAASRYGVEATGITLSEPQAALARERAALAGVADRVTVRVADYRELGGERFDKIASVGMYEHVGWAELDTYVATLLALVRPGGLVLNHGITQLREHPPNPKSFIARYIFPGGELHPVAAVIGSLQSAGLEVRDVESLREHYPLTLRAWVANLRDDRDAALALVGAERTRTWELYLLGSALGFETGEISVYQVLAARTGAPHGLPLDRIELLAGHTAAPAV